MKKSIILVVALLMAVVSTAVYFSKGKDQQGSIKSAVMRKTSVNNYLFFQYIPIEWQANFSTAHSVIRIDVVDTKNNIMRNACAHGPGGTKIRGMKCSWDGTTDDEGAPAPSGLYKFKAWVGEPPQEDVESQLFFFKEGAVEKTRVQ